MKTKQILNIYKTHKIIRNIYSKCRDNDMCIVNNRRIFTKQFIQKLLKINPTLSTDVNIADAFDFSKKVATKFALLSDAFDIRDSGVYLSSRVSELLSQSIK